MLSEQDNELLTRTDKGTVAGECFRRFWTPALMSEEIPEPDCPPVRVRLMGENLIAFRDSSGRPALVGAYCMHRQVDLFFGRNEHNGIRCTYHGWKFDRDGNCVEIPTEPATSTYKDRIKLTAYPCQEHAGFVWAYLGPREKQPPFPKFEYMGLPKEHLYIKKSLLECNYFQALEGHFDSSHIGFLHRFLSPEGSTPAVAGLALGGPKELATAVRDAAVSYEVHDTDYGFMLAAKRSTGNGKSYTRVTQWLLPFHTMIPSTEGETLLQVAWVPMDDEHTWVYRAQYNPWRPISKEEIYEIENLGVMQMSVQNIPGTYVPVRNKSNNYLLDRNLQRTYNYSGIKGNNSQDAAVTENQGPTPIADRTQEHLVVGDVGIVRGRRRLLKMLRDFEAGIEPPLAQKAELYRMRPIAMMLEDGGAPFYEAAKEKMYV